MNSVEQRGSRFFVSYRRRAVEDARLARRLVDELRAAGHQVFIDVDIPVGTDWSAEITQRIRWCDYLVVLLSADSIDSEMVQGEVRLAHQQRRADGSPHVFPIRVRYAGALDYELNSYLGRLQHVAWNDPADDATVVGTILAAARMREGAGVADAAPPLPAAAPTDDARRPQPSVDRTALLRPTGTLRLADRYYIQRPADAAMACVAAGEGETLVIKGPRQVGKSSLLVRYIAACRQAAKRVVYVDFQSISDAQLADYPAFLQGLLAVLLRRLERPVDTLPAIESGLDATDVVEAQILDRLDGPLVFAFDEVDRVLGRPWQKEFFALLRSWHNRRWEPAWARVDLALVIATEPYLLVDSADQSPFNVGELVTVRPFFGGGGRRSQPALRRAAVGGRVSGPVRTDQRPTLPDARRVVSPGGRSRYPLEHPAGHRRPRRRTLRRPSQGAADDRPSGRARGSAARGDQARARSSRWRSADHVLPAARRRSGQ